MWPFVRKKWEKLGSVWTATGLTLLLTTRAEEVWLRDTDYRAVPLKDFQVLMWNCRPQPLETYRAEIFDCDDAAGCFEADMRREWAKRSHGNEALAFGYIEACTPAGVRHAFIWQLDTAGKLTYIEPQNNSVIQWLPTQILLMEG